jgi:hypothetical protein
MPQPVFKKIFLPNNANGLGRPLLPFGSLTTGWVYPKVEKTKEHANDPASAGINMATRPSSPAGVARFQIFSRKFPAVRVDCETVRGN